MKTFTISIAAMAILGLAMPGLAKPTGEPLCLKEA